MKNMKKLVMTMALCGAGYLCVAQTQVLSVGKCVSYTVPNAEAATTGATYKWMENETEIAGAAGAAYTNAAGKDVAGKYEYIRLAQLPGCDTWMESNVFTVYVGGTGNYTDPGATVNFATFNPASCAAVGSTWFLTDSRESGNVQTYRVRKMPDGHIWMIDDMKFGDKCDKTAFTGSSTVTGDQTGSKLTSISGYTYGDCRNNTGGNGYLYDWAAAIQKAGAYYGSTVTVGCSGVASGTSGTNPGACRGICPVGWHIPTGTSSGEYQALHTAQQSAYSCTNDGCWNTGSIWEGVLGGYCSSGGSLDGQGSYAYYWSSTYRSSPNAYYLYFGSGNVDPGTDYYNKYYGRSVRCVRNY